MSLSIAPFSWGQAAVKAFGPAGFDVEALKLLQSNWCSLSLIGRFIGLASPVRAGMEQELHLLRLGCRKGHSQKT